MNAATDWIQHEIDHLKHLATKWKGKAVTEISTLEDEALPLFKQIQTNLSAEAYALAKTELATVLAAAMSGGGLAAVGAAIASTVPALITKLALDSESGAKNALYAIAAFEQARLASAA